jgi:hypothetical protein
MAADISPISHLSDLVEKDRAPIGQLSKPFLVCNRTGESALDVT